MPAGIRKLLDGSSAMQPKAMPKLIAGCLRRKQPAERDNRKEQRSAGSWPMLKPCAISISGGPYSDDRCAGQYSNRSHCGTTPSAVSTRSRLLMCRLLNGVKGWNPPSG